LRGVTTGAKSHLKFGKEFAGKLLFLQETVGDGHLSKGDERLDVKFAN
jgi:hypothetical protein